MSCALAITDVIAEAAPGTDRVARLIVRGTSAGCTTVRMVVAKVERNGTLSYAPVGPSDVDVSPAGAPGGPSWEIVFEPTILELACGDTITVLVSCSDAAGCTAQRIVSPIRCCPTGMTLTASPGACAPDGTRDVTFSVSIDSPSPGVAVLDFGDGSAGHPIVYIQGTNSHTITHSYATDPSQPLTYTAAVAATDPASCPAGAATQLTVQPCAADPCPTLGAITAHDEGCARALRRSIRLDVQVTTATAVDVRFLPGDSTSPVFAPAPAGSNTLTFRHDYPADTTHVTSFTARVSFPGRPDCGARDEVIRVAPCPPCPVVEPIAVSVGHCDGSGRTVDMSVEIRAAAAGRARWSWDDGTPPEEFDFDATTTDYSAVHTYAADPSFPLSRTIRLDILTPATCVGRNAGIVIDPCPEPPDCPTIVAVRVVGTRPCVGGLAPIELEVELRNPVNGTGTWTLGDGTTVSIPINTGQTRYRLEHLFPAAPNGTRSVSASFTIPGCGTFELTVTVPACPGGSAVPDSEVGVPQFGNGATPGGSTDQPDPSSEPEDGRGSDRGRGRFPWCAIAAGAIVAGLLAAGPIAIALGVSVAVVGFVLGLGIVSAAIAAFRCEQCSLGRAILAGAIIGLAVLLVVGLTVVFPPAGLLWTMIGVGVGTAALGAFLAATAC